jgi:hypothetical protein
MPSVAIGDDITRLLTIIYVPVYKIRTSELQG